MTDFDYQIEVERIYAAKNAYELEELIRKYKIDYYQLKHFKLSQVNEHN